MTSGRAVPRAALALLLLAPSVSGQDEHTIRLRSSEGSTVSLAVAYDRGYASIPLSTFEGLGWSVASDGRTIALRGPEATEVVLHGESPFFRWNDEVLQATDVPYEGGGATMLPLQLLTDFLPHRLPALYSFDEASGTLAIEGSGFDALRIPTSAAAGGRPTPAAATTRAAPAARPPEPEPPSPYEGPRVVVIDAGHGGDDPGTLGPGGITEKDVALGIARALAETLRRDTDLEVHETRDDDSLVPIWDRGELATEVKGDRPGVFVSIHANSFPQRRQVRGFETYFLSEARTEHERRVAAIENAPLRVEQIAAREEEEPDLGFILRELRTLDDQHWSALLAELVQRELETFHPGPNRGVKQGLLAVLTNAVMPSVLVEVGYLSHSEEARLLSRQSFQQDAAEAIARAIRSFFERYPPGSGSGG